MELRWQDAYQQFSAAEDEQQLFQRMAAYSKRLGFEYCCYGIRVPLPVSKPAVAIFNTYPEGWMAHYQSRNYIDIDSTVRDGVHSTNMIVWPDVDRIDPCPLWQDARDFGLSVGVAQSSWAARGAFGLLSIARHADPLTPAEGGGAEYGRRHAAHSINGSASFAVQLTLEMLFSMLIRLAICSSFC